MSTLDQAPCSAAAGRGNLWPKFVPAGLLNRALGVFGAIRSRAKIINLLDFDDAQLADLGLTRGDVEKALRGSITTDPSHHLIRARQNPLRGIRRP